MKDISLVIAGVGGQGVITATTIIGMAALKRGIYSVSSEVHGMAQRGGAVSVDMRIGQKRSPLIGRGEADVILAFEPVEAYRVLLKLKKGGLIIASVNPIYPFTVNIGQEKYPDVDLLFTELSKVARLIKIDALSMATRVGSTSALNMVMVGAFSKATENVLGIPLECYEEAIKEYFSDKDAEVNLKAFMLGRESINIHGL